MHIITRYLATPGLEWQFDNPDADILEPDENGFMEGFAVLDLREAMVDGPNHPSIYQKLVDEAIALIQKHSKVVICCSAGISRSNSIAIGVLMKWQQMDFHRAFELVIEKVPIANPKACHLECIKLL